jgi:uncharacterized protein YjbJ (UPF0337 family)
MGARNRTFRQGKSRVCSESDAPMWSAIWKGCQMAEKNGAAEGISGVVEGVKGKAKEVAGAVAGRDDLRREGEAQQDKADAQRQAAEKEAEAASARSAAEANEARQKAQQ